MYKRIVTDDKYFYIQKYEEIFDYIDITDIRGISEWKFVTNGSFWGRKKKFKSLEEAEKYIEETIFFGYGYRVIKEYK